MLVFFTHFRLFSFFFLFFEFIVSIIDFVVFDSNRYHCRDDRLNFQFRFRFQFWASSTIIVQIAIIIFFYEFFICFIVTWIYILENHQNKKDEWTQKMKIEIASIENSTSIKCCIWNRDRTIYSKEKQNKFTKRANEKDEKQKSQQKCIVNSAFIVN